VKTNNIAAREGTIDLSTVRFGEAEIAVKRDGNSYKKEPVVGWLIGPFVVWDDGFGHNVTHIRTGYKVQNGIWEQARALVFAARISTMADWDFTDPAAVTGWPPDVSGPIHTLRVWAANDQVDDPYGLVMTTPLEEPAESAEVEGDA
jgi:hypothetical protein